LPLPHPSSQYQKDAAPDSGPREHPPPAWTQGGGGEGDATQRKQGREASARARKPPTAHRHSPAEPSAAISAATLVKLLSPLGYSKIKKKPGGEFSPFFKTYFLNENIPLFFPNHSSHNEFFIIKSNRQH
jgi:hypothetical protein